MEFLLFILAGAGVGLAVGVTGVGGGSLMTPLLILFGIPYHIAIGTDLLYAATTKAGGVVTHSRQGTVKWKLVALLAAGSLPASIATAFFLKKVFGDAADYEHILTMSLGVMLVLTALVLLLKRRKHPSQDAPKLSLEEQETPSVAKNHATLITLLAGVFLGVFVTLSSVGAGAFCAALLLVLYPRLPALKVVGTDIAHAVPLTFIAGIGHLFLNSGDPGNAWVVGNVDFLLLISLLVGSLPAVHLGSKLGAKLPSHVLQPILATILLILGIKFTLF